VGEAVPASKRYINGNNNNDKNDNDNGGREKGDFEYYCEHPYLTPSKNRTLCVLPGRIDIGRHLILTGGARGLRERYSKVR
jgi:hypothetical protein